jgi:hypothetical protein
MPASRFPGTAGSVSSTGQAIAQCGRCGHPSAFSVPLPMLPPPGLDLAVWRGCNHCGREDWWVVTRARPDAPAGDAPELVSARQVQAACRRATATAERQAEPVPAPAKPAEPEDRHTLSQWAQAARGLGPARRSVIATVLAVPPVTVARHFRRLYGLEPRWDRSCSYRTYSWSELAAIATELEAAA